jgi:hypothetical protein
MYAVVGKSRPLVVIPGIIGAMSKHLERPVLRSFRQGPAPPSPAHQGGHTECETAPLSGQTSYQTPPGGVRPCGKPVVTEHVF